MAREGLFFTKILKKISTKNRLQGHTFCFEKPGREVISVL